MPDGLAIVTGATGGLGYETALGLAHAGHDVLLTGRNPRRGQSALDRLKKLLPNARARFQLLDVGSLGAIQQFAAAIEQPVAVLVNNAGVMALPERQLTEDGFERQFGVNYLGHFALTARLLPRLRDGRVVSVSSLAHRRGAIRFDDLQGEAAYSPWGAYAQSKLAMLMFAIELQRRSTANDWGVTGFAAHPGWSATRIVANGPGEGRPGPLAHLMQAGFNALGQSAKDGARPILFAALDPAARPGAYYGPCCWGETRGKPAKSRVSPQASRPADQARLWDISETLTGAPFATSPEH